MPLVGGGISPDHGQSNGSLGRDSVFRGIIVAVVLASIPLLLPVLSEEWRATYGHYLIYPPFLVALILAIRFRLRSVAEPGERRFWNLLTFGWAWWMVALVVGPLADLLLADSKTLQEFVKNLPYLMFYGAVAVALEAHPHVRSDPLTRQLRTLDRAGSFVLLLGLLVYFLVVPSISYWYASGLWSSSLALFVAFDGYIILRLWHCRESATSHEWRLVYSWLLIAASLWGIGDLMLALMYEGILTDPGWGTPFDLLWPLSFAAVVVATRPTVVQRGYDAAIAPFQKPLAMGRLVVYALVPLIFHVTLYRFGFADPQLSMTREVLVLGMTVILAGMTMAYHKLLLIENSRLAEEETRARENLVHQAFHDELTGLPNRNLFRDRLQLAIASSTRYQRKCAVMFCDLDQFKVINDSLGHEAGDQALIATAQRLRTLLRKQDTVARLGGDEFAVIAPGMHRATDVASLAEKLLAAISEPLVIGRKNHVLTGSIGIAVFPDDGEEEEVLLKHADTAMYQSKLHGRNTYRLFTDAMNDAADERLAVEQGLRTGLIEDRFSVFYQPIVGLETGKPVSYEALLRWNHPERGYISPVNFIDVAEQTGLIVPIGIWVLETACAWAVQFQPTGEDPPCVSVNVSPRQFQEPDLAQEIARILKDTGLDASRLHLEITESVALTTDSTATTLSMLRGLGVRIALDNFGTGYAALSLLQDLPVDIVKIDRSFVRGIEADSVSETIVRAIVTMASALDFYVVAEGVETEAELNAIRQFNCDAAQGYYLCKPLSSQELQEMVTDDNTWAWEERV